MAIEATSEAVLEFVEKWIELLSNGQYREAYDQLSQPPHDTWSPELLEDVTSSYELSPSAGDLSETSRVTSVTGARVVDYRPDKDVDWYEGNPDSNAGMVHYSIPINGIWSDLTATFRIQRINDGVVLQLEDMHVM